MWKTPFSVAIIDFFFKNYSFFVVEKLNVTFCNFLTFQHTYKGGFFSVDMWKIFSSYQLFNILKRLTDRTNIFVYLFDLVREFCT